MRLFIISFTEITVRWKLSAAEGRTTKVYIILSNAYNVNDNQRCKIMLGIDNNCKLFSLSHWEGNCYDNCASSLLSIYTLDNLGKNLSTGNKIFAYNCLGVNILYTR